jgi:ADP-ribose pyrophosphatase YjhB (NUDIX family)
LRSAASSSRTEEEATAEEAVAEAAKEEVGFDFARRALMSAGTDAGAAAPQARSISEFLLRVGLASPLRSTGYRDLWIGIFKLRIHITATWAHQETSTTSSIPVYTR